MSSWGLARRSIIRLVITIPRIMFPIYIMRTYRQASSVVYHHCSKTVLMKSWHCVLTGKLTAWRQIPRQKKKERKVTFHAVHGNALHLPPTTALSHHQGFLPRNGFAPFPKEWFLMNRKKAKALLSGLRCPISRNSIVFVFLSFMIVSFMYCRLPRLWSAYYDETIFSPQWEKILKAMRKNTHCDEK